MARRKFFRDEENPYDIVSQPASIASSTRIGDTTSSPQQVVSRSEGQYVREADVIRVSPEIRSPSVRYTMQLPAGEPLLAGKPVSIGGITTYPILRIPSVAAVVDLYGEPGGAFGQWAQSISESIGSFVTSVRISMSRSGSPTDDVVCAIQGDSGNAPDGLDLATATIIGSSIAAFPSATVCEFILSIGVPFSGDRKWIVLRRTGSRDLTNYYRITYTNLDGYPSGIAKHRMSGSWTINTASDDLSFHLYSTIASGLVSYATASTTASTNGYVGFTTVNADYGGQAEIVVSGSINQSALSTTNKYYLSDERGTIGTSAGTNSKVVGLAIDTDELLLSNIV